MKVFIDPGHSGIDSGATGNGIKEKDITLSVAKLVELELKQQGVQVDLSRYNDTTMSLKERTDKANRLKSDCLVSIHCNDAENKSAQGIETFCYKYKYRKLADYVHNELLATGAYTKDRGVKEGNLHMVRESNMPACLIELAFIGNKEDSELLKTKQNIFAKAIAKGICKFLNITYKEENPKEPIYNIITGGFGSKENAQNELNKLKDLTEWHLTLEEFEPGNFRVRTGGFTGLDRTKTKMEALSKLTGWWCDYILE